MSENKLKITWDELRSRKVENRLKEQNALARNRAYASADEATIATPAKSRSGLRYNTLVYMAAFGLIGGLVAWSVGALLQFKSSAREEAASLVHEMNNLVAARDTGRFTATQVEQAVRQLADEGRDNEYFAVQVDDTLAPAEKLARVEQLAARDRAKEFIANVLAYGAWGLIIALSLAVAEPLVQHNTTAAIVNGSIGAVVGLVGGISAALFVDRLHALAGHFANFAEANIREIISQVVVWSVLGLFLSVGGGIVLKNVRKLVIGLVGGAVGGAIGGALFQPIVALTSNLQDARLVALMAIGAFAAVATGLIENAARNGWLRVIAGVLAGKQFILYRNPTFIGSSPDCQIYLFKDPDVGGKHAAIHIVPGGFELEDLPLGTPTAVNGKPIRRARLRHGDRVQVGKTSFLFQEKTKGKKDAAASPARR